MTRISFIKDMLTPEKKNFSFKMFRKNVLQMKEEKNENEELTENERIRGL